MSVVASSVPQLSLQINVPALTVHLAPLFFCSSRAHAALFCWMQQLSSRRLQSLWTCRPWGWRGPLNRRQRDPVLLNWRWPCLVFLPTISTHDRAGVTACHCHKSRLWIPALERNICPSSHRDVLRCVRSAVWTHVSWIDIAQPSSDFRVVGRLR